MGLSPGAVASDRRKRRSLRPGPVYRPPPPSLDTKLLEFFISSIAAGDWPNDFHWPGHQFNNSRPLQKQVAPNVQLKHWVIRQLDQREQIASFTKEAISKPLRELSTGDPMRLSVVARQFVSEGENVNGLTERKGQELSFFRATSTGRQWKKA